MKRITISFQTIANPFPLMIIFFIMITNHLAGIKSLSHCKITGMFLIGKIKPDSKIVGSNKANILNNMATCWVSLTVEINTPRLNANSIKSKLTANNSGKLPVKGISKTK